MGLGNPLHILILLVVVLLVFGAKRLPEIGRSLGEGMRGFKDTIHSGPEHVRLDHVAPVPVPYEAASGSVEALVPVTLVPVPAAVAAGHAAASGPTETAA